MKKHHLISVFTLLFCILFYHEGCGINVSLFAVVIIFLTYYRSPTKTFIIKILSLLSLFAAFAFAWYGDASSFFSLCFSIVFLLFESQEKKLHLIQAIPIAIINIFTSIVRPLVGKNWLPTIQLSNDGAKKIIALLLIPMFFLLVFFVAYTYGSDTFSNLFMFELDLNLFDLFWIFLLGFYISFNIFSSFVPSYCYTINPFLNNELSRKNKELRPSFSYLDLNLERKSGEISLLLLNMLLLIFIISYNYEQFFKPASVSGLSSGTHERVNAVIMSIILAVGVLLFYFKSSFNFDAKAVLLKRLAVLWLTLNAVLIISTAIKNSEYILHFGLTYKRLGVFAFLSITLIGLFFTFLKIKFKKANAYLFNQMLWVMYTLLLVCSFINWGNIITIYNIKTNKGVDSVFLSSLNFNDQARLDYFASKIGDVNSNEDFNAQEIKRHQEDSLLSKILYYEFLKK